MVVTHHGTRSEAAAVAGRVAELYRANGSTDVAVESLGDLAPAAALGAHVTCVTVASQRAVEIVLDAATEPGGVAADLAALVADDWTVTVLVPSPRMGLAHVALRGTGCSMQQWWRDGAAIGFGIHEIP